MRAVLGILSAVELNARPVSHLEKYRLMYRMRFTPNTTNFYSIMPLMMIHMLGGVLDLNAVT